eukprot:g33567.t1
MALDTFENEGEEVAKDARNLSRCFPASMVGSSYDLLVSEARTQRSYERLAAYGLPGAKYGGRGSSAPAVELEPTLSEGKVEKLAWAARELTELLRVKIQDDGDLLLAMRVLEDLVVGIADASSVRCHWWPKVEAVRAFNCWRTRDGRNRPAFDAGMAPTVHEKRELWTHYLQKATSIQPITEVSGAVVVAPALRAAWIIGRRNLEKAGAVISSWRWRVVARRAQCKYHEEASWLFLARRREKAAVQAFLRWSHAAASTASARACGHLLTAQRARREAREAQHTLAPVLAAWWGVAAEQRLEAAEEALKVALMLEAEPEELEQEGLVWATERRRESWRKERCFIAWCEVMDMLQRGKQLERSERSELELLTRMTFMGDLVPRAVLHRWQVLAARSPQRSWKRLVLGSRQKHRKQLALESLVDALDARARKTQLGGPLACWARLVARSLQKLRQQWALESLVDALDARATAARVASSTCPDEEEAAKSARLTTRWVEQLLVQVSFTSWKSSSLAAQHGRELGEHSERWQLQRILKEWCAEKQRRSTRRWLQAEMQQAVKAQHCEVLRAVLKCWRLLSCKEKAARREALQVSFSCWRCFSSGSRAATADSRAAPRPRAEPTQPAERCEVPSALLWRLWSSWREAVRMRRLTLRWAQAWCRSRHREWLRRCFRHWCEAERSASDVSPIPVEEAVTDLGDEMLEGSFAKQPEEEDLPLEPEEGVQPEEEQAPPTVFQPLFEPVTAQPATAWPMPAWPVAASDPWRELGVELPAAQSPRREELEKRTYLKRMPILREVMRRGGENPLDRGGGKGSAWDMVSK